MMREDKEERAISLRLIAQLKDHGSWCGETNIQKAFYFYQELFKGPPKFHFVLYKHGPYSFELHNELEHWLEHWLGYGYLKMLTEEPFGAHIYPTERAKAVIHKYRTSIENRIEKIEYITAALAPLNISKLESRATALYIIRRGPNEEPANPETVAARVRELKPHIHQNGAREAVEHVVQLIRGSPT